MRLILRALKGVDLFLLLLIATVVVASLLPARGQGVPVFDGLANAAIMLLFFLHGAKLSRAAIGAGAGNWRLHLMVMASSFVLFPILGLGLSILARPIAAPEILAGLLFLSLLPSTVQSSIAFTAMAGGNVPAAVCSASLSNLTGIAITPLLVALLMNVGGAGHGGAIDGVGNIVVQLLLPFVTGHLLRPWIGGWVDSHKALLRPVDQSSILLVVYTAFSAAVVQGIWQKVSTLDLATIVGLSAVLLAMVMGANVVMARRAGLPREDAIVLLFCGSKKSLVSGVPMAGALFAPAMVGVLILPLMIFHQLQLIVCAVIAGRYRKQLERE